jgi:hypothetical protein
MRQRVRVVQPALRRSFTGRAVTSAAMLGVIGVLVCGCAHAPPGSQPIPPPAGSKQLSIWLTGYSWQDNTPPGSSIVGEPVLHKQASGQGTFADPITVAVPGHRGDMDWEPGTKFYLPTVQRYVIVEDSGAAKPPHGADTHLDMWIAGQDGTKQATDDCASQFTGNVPAQVNPPDNLPVITGPIFAGGKCNIPPQPDDMGTYKGRHHEHHHRHHHDDSNNGDSDSDSN